MCFLVFVPQASTQISTPKRLKQHERKAFTKHLKKNAKRIPKPSKMGEGNQCACLSYLLFPILLNLLSLLVTLGLFFTNVLSISSPKRKQKTTETRSKIDWLASKDTLSPTNHPSWGQLKIHLHPARRNARSDPPPLRRRAQRAGCTILPRMTAQNFCHFFPTPDLAPVPLLNPPQPARAFRRVDPLSTFLAIFSHLFSGLDFGSIFSSFILSILRPLAVPFGHPKSEKTQQKKRQKKNAKRLLPDFASWCHNCLNCWPPNPQNSLEFIIMYAFPRFSLSSPLDASWGPAGSIWGVLAVPKTSQNSKNNVKKARSNSITLFVILLSRSGIDLGPKIVAKLLNAPLFWFPKCAPCVFVLSAQF